MQKKRIMVVDDSLSTVRAVQVLLEAEGFEVIPAYSGWECLNELEKKPDLVLLDIMMPGMDGREVLRRIREVNKKLKVIFLTAVGATEELGAADYITKPFDNEDLVRRVKRALD